MRKALILILLSILFALALLGPKDFGTKGDTKYFDKM